MKHAHLHALLIGGALLVGTMPAMSADPVDERKQGFKDAKRSVSAVKDAIESDDTATVRALAQDMATFAHKIPELFPPGSKGGFFSAAKEGIWTRFPDFVEKSVAFEQAAGGLAVAADTKPVSKTALVSAYKNLTQSCASCHQDYKRGR